MVAAPSSMAFFVHPCISSPVRSARRWTRCWPNCPRSDGHLVAGDGQASLAIDVLVEVLVEVADMAAAANSAGLTPVIPAKERVNAGPDV